MAAALSTAAIELSELRGGCWEAAAFARADATLGSLIELALHGSAEATAAASAGRAAPPPPRGGTDVAWLLGADAPAAAEAYGDVGAILDEVLTGTLPALSHRSAGLAKCCLTELYAVTPRLRALLSSLTPPERAAGGALTASLFSLVDELAAAPPSWPLPAGAKGWVALQHGDLQAAHVFADARGRCWLLRGAHRAGPAHALSDLSKLCASLLFLGSALPLSRADLRGLPPWRIARSCGSLMATRSCSIGSSPTRRPSQSCSAPCASRRSPPPPPAASSSSSPPTRNAPRRCARCAASWSGWRRCRRSVALMPTTPMAATRRRRRRA